MKMSRKVKLAFRETLTRAAAEKNYMTTENSVQAEFTQDFTEI